MFTFKKNTPKVRRFSDTSCEHIGKFNIRSDTISSSRNQSSAASVALIPSVSCSQTTIPLLRASRPIESRDRSLELTFNGD